MTGAPLHRKEGNDSTREPTDEKGLKGTPPNWAWMLAFLSLAIAVLVFSHFFPTRNPDASRNHRVLIALASAGLAAAIPGFIRLRFGSWLQAGGALGIFVLVFMLDPVASGSPTGPDLSGNWVYECVAHAIEPNKDGPGGTTVSDYSHGGVATIEVSETDYGISLSFTGHRKWMEVNGKREEVDYVWETSWATMIDPTSIRLEYEVQVPEGTIKGYGWAKIELKDGKPHVIKGNFWQLPPTRPLFGKMEFKRVD